MSAPTQQNGIGTWEVGGTAGSVAVPWRRRRRWRRNIGFGAVVTAVLGGAVVAVTNPFSTPGPKGTGVIDNAYPTSVTTVKRQELLSQTEVQGTLGYADPGNGSAPANVELPAGVPPTQVDQARQQVATARLAVQADGAALAALQSGNSDSAVQAQVTQRTAQQALAAAEQALSTTRSANSQALAQAAQQLGSARAALAAANEAVRNTQASNSESTAQAAQQLAQAQQALRADEASVRNTQASNSESTNQAAQQLSQAQQALSADQATLQAGSAALTAEQEKAAADCSAAGPATSSDASGSGSANTVACSTDEQAVSQDQAAAQADEQKVVSDKAAVKSARAGLASTATDDQKALLQAQGQVAQAQAQVSSAKTSVASTATNDQKALLQAQGQVAQAQAQVSSAKAGVASTGTSNTKALQQAEAQVASAQGQVALAKAGASSTGADNAKAVQQARAQVAAARLTLSQDQATLASDLEYIGSNGGGSGGSGGGSGGGGAATPTYTSLPAIGQVVARGQQLLAVNNQPVLLLYGSVAPWRAFRPGMSPGRDVAELNANLAALGYGSSLSGDVFGAATAAALGRLEAAHGQAANGSAALGSLVFEPGAVQVDTVTAQEGSPVSTSQPVLTVTLTARQVQVALDAAQQGGIAVGDKVSIVMPDNSTTPGVVAYVGHIATVPSANNGNGGSGNPTVDVNITPLDPAATGNLDQLPVNVWITTQTAPHALVVPVNALVALAGGGYALEVIGAHHYLEQVSLGLFDDADGLVQVTGNGVRAGQRVVVPAL